MVGNVKYTCNRISVIHRAQDQTMDRDIRENGSVKIHSNSKCDGVGLLVLKVEGII